MGITTQLTEMNEYTSEGKGFLGAYMSLIRIRLGALLATTGPRQWLLLLEALSRALVSASICRLLVQEVVRARHWARIPIGLGHSCLVVLGAKRRWWAQPTCVWHHRRPRLLRHYQRQRLLQDQPRRLQQRARQQAKIRGRLVRTLLAALEVRRCSWEQGPEHITCAS